ncbi:MAG: hypothetical protein JKY94_16705 [Rhodobacteraceae bacterium]|nr:hypothetical protein [Paracoccaceae bacterium]
MQLFKLSSKTTSHHIVLWAKNHTEARAEAERRGMDSGGYRISDEGPPKSGVVVVLDVKLD